MTLCIAWRDNQAVHFSSDSRISFGGSLPADIGAKVVAVPLKVFSEFSQKRRSEQLVYDHTIGLCFDGSLVNAYTVKESLYAVFQRVETVNHTFSFEKICDLIRYVFEHTSQDVCKSLSKKGYEMLGSGKSEAVLLIQKDSKLKMSSVLRKVIHDGHDKNVGGNIQYGRFKDEDFRVLAVLDFDLKGKKIKPKITLHGMTINNKAFPMNRKKLLIVPPIVPLFVDEMKEIGKADKLKEVSDSNDDREMVP